MWGWPGGVILEERIANEELIVGVRPRWLGVWRGLPRVVAPGLNDGDTLLPMANPPLTVYGYMKCDSCRKAMKWLDARGRAHRFVDITERPPTAAELGEVLREDRYELKHLFNTSGQLYRSMKIKDKLAGMTEDEALALLAGHGMLIKRPVVSDGTRWTVGFKEGVFGEVWG